MRLLAVELRRALARRLVAVVALLGVLAVGLVLYGVWQSAKPLTEAQLEDARQQYAFALEDWEENGEQMVADCEREEERESERVGEAVDFGCDQMTPPQEEWFVPEAPELAANFAGMLTTTSLLLVFLTLVVGATLTAAELSTGALSTWLTFVPQRMRVLVSKLGAGALVGLALTAALTALLVGGLYGVHASRGALGDLTGEVWGDVGEAALRIVVLGGVVALVAAALGILLRHTAAVLGVVVGYALVLEGIIGGIVPRTQPFLLRTNLTGWLEGGTSYWVNECEVTAQGTMCEGVEVPLSFAHSAVFLGVVVAVVLAVTALVFRRRDVA